jgi:hypothetical protein
VATDSAELLTFVKKNLMPKMSDRDISVPVSGQWSLVTPLQTDKKCRCRSKVPQLSTGILRYQTEMLNV